MIKKHSVKIAGHPSSITLEDEFWNILRFIVKHQKVTINDLITTIDEERNVDNLSSAVRLYILDFILKHPEMSFPIPDA